MEVVENLCRPDPGQHCFPASIDSGKRTGKETSAGIPELQPLRSCFRKPKVEDKDGRENKTKLAASF